MADVPPDPTPWYANKGVPIGIILYLIALTVGGTAYITNLADRVAFMEKSVPTHGDIASRLAVIEIQIKRLLDHNGVKD